MSKITGTITSTVTIGSAGFNSPLTITKTGVVSVYAGYYKGRYSAPGLYLNHTGVATIVNDGFVEGAGGSGQYQSNGGAGVYLKTAATLTNGGTIFGAEAGGDQSGGGTGAGVEADGTGITIHNTALIEGGTGTSFIYGPTNGGIGVQVSGGDVVTNTGTIDGGAGGNAGQYYNYATDGAGGDGLLAGTKSANSVTNSGLIQGGTGGHAIAAGFGSGSNGGEGVYLGNGVLTNTGKIFGGAGGGYYGGQFGDLTAIGGTGGTGADIHGVLNNSGTIFGGGGGIGGRYGGDGGTGVQLSEGAALTNSGTITGGGGYAAVYAYTQGRGGDGVDGAYANILNSGKITGGAAGGGYYAFKGGTGVYLKGGTLTNSGTITGGADADHPSNAGAAVYLKVASDYHNKVLYLTPSTLVVDPGAVFKGAVISENYFVPSLVNSSGGRDNILEVAGTSTKALSGIGTSFTGFTDISFATGAAWTIQGNGAGLTSGQEIYGFTAGDTIDVSSLHFNANDKVSVATAGTVSITQGATVTKIDIVGATKGESDFHVSKDKSGGTDLTRGTQPKMNFLGSTISNAGVVPVDKTLPPLEHAGGWMGVGTDGRNHVSVGIDLRPYGAVPAVMTPSVPFDGLFVPVTVQAG